MIGKRFRDWGLSRVFSICILTLFFLVGAKVPAQENITASIADNAKLVRVAISDNSFKSLIYKDISVTATSDYFIYAKSAKKLIVKAAPSDILNIKYKDSNFTISANNKVIASNIEGILVVDCPKGLLGVKDLKRSSKQALYHGVFEITPKNEYLFFLVNVLDLENYLKGVVPNEMPVRFGLEALKAQAVAARNYVLLPRTKNNKDFDVDDSVASQVYFGANTENELSNQAVKQTEGLVALYGWDLILAQYCSTAGGYTENYENVFSDPSSRKFPPDGKPYLKGRPDIFSVPPLNREEEAKLFYMGYPESYDMKSPYYRWQRSWDVNAMLAPLADKNAKVNPKELNNVLQKTLIDQSKTGFVKPLFKEGDDLGEIKALNVPKRGVSGKIVELEIVTDKGTYHVQKELVIRRLLTKDGKALPSANVVFENIYDANKKLYKVTAYGGGFGHGVGMSQFGAGFMATSLHKTYDKILKRYYTGITISTVPSILSSSPSQNIISQSFFAPKAKAVLVVDNKYKIKEFNAVINGKNVAFEIANSLVPFCRVSRIDISSFIKPGRNTAVFYFPEKESNKAIRLYIELVEKDDNEYNF